MHRHIHLCEICGKRRATSICLRCRRLVCNDCLGSVGLCIDCYNIKKVLELDGLRALNYVKKMANICSNMLEKSRECLGCIVLREMLISLYKMLRDLTHEARKELYGELLRKAKELEPKVRNLLIKVIVAHGGISIPETKKMDESDITYT